MDNSRIRPFFRWLTFRRLAKKTFWIATACLAVGHHVAVAEPNVLCPAAIVLPQLDAAYHACHQGYIDGSCKRFIDAFKKVTGRYDCQRSFDSGDGAVPAVWLAPRGALEDFIALAWRLASDPQFKKRLYKNIRSEARRFFGSKDFQGVLDGALAEDYLDKSQQIARELKTPRP